MVMLHILFLWLASCSVRYDAARDWRSLELSLQSIIDFTAHLTLGSSHDLVTELREWLAVNESYQQLCLKYFIGSAAIFGQVDNDALNVIYNLCKIENVRYVSDLSGRLKEQNNCDTVAQFIAEAVMSGRNARFFKGLIKELMEKDWRTMEALITKVLSILKDNRTLCHIYKFISKRLPVERQYDMINAKILPLDIIKDLFVAGEFAPLLREMFALARCSGSPSPRIRKYIANNSPYFRQFLPDTNVNSIMASCSRNIPSLNDDAWYNVFTLSDVETLLFVLPLVCKSWCRLYLKVLTNCTKVHDLYLRDLSHCRLKHIHKVAPWKYCLVNEANASKYLGRCIMDGALGRFESKSAPQDDVEMYLMAVMYGIFPFPKVRNSVSLYDSFLRLFEMVYTFCANSELPFNKPVIFTNEEYERAVHYLVCGRKLVLNLDPSLVVNNMPKLFRIIKENERMMKDLILKNFADSSKPSITLVMHGQMSGIPEELARLVFSQNDLFRRLIEPNFIEPSKYYDFIVESGILSELITNVFWMTRLSRLVVSLILHFKNDLDKIDRIVMTTIGRLSSYDGGKLKDMRQVLGKKLSKVLLGKDSYPTEDVVFVKRIVVMCGLCDEPET